jgi:hypothetical protein
VTLAQRALFRVLLVVLATVLALLVTAPADHPAPAVTIATAPDSTPVIYQEQP